MNVAFLTSIMHYAQGKRPVRCRPKLALSSVRRTLVKSRNPLRGNGSNATDAPRVYKWCVPAQSPLTVE